MDVQAHGLFIGGRTVPSASGSMIEILDPATNHALAQVAAGTKDDVNAAVEAARNAFDSPEWRDLDPSKRGRLVLLPGQQVRDHFQGRSRPDATHVGDPLRDARGRPGRGHKPVEY